jgi:hypothetical protein
VVPELIFVDLGALLPMPEKTIEAALEVNPEPVKT